MPASLASLELDQRRLTAAMRAFLRDALPEVVDKAVRKVAFDVVAETQKALNGTMGGLPKRIDTGRLRGGWRVALEQGGINTKGLRRAATNTDADGTAKQSGRGLKANVVVTNRVEYARHVELGTVHMAPGMHLTRALRVVAQQVPKARQPESLRAEIRRAWTRG